MKGRTSSGLQTDMIVHVAHDNKKRVFRIVTAERGALTVSYDALRLASHEQVEKSYIDPDTASTVFVYESYGNYHTHIPLDAVLEALLDPRFMRDLALYKITVQADKIWKGLGQMERRSALKRMRLPAHRDRHSGAEPKNKSVLVKRLLKTTNYNKTLDDMYELLYAMGARVETQTKI